MIGETIQNRRGIPVAGSSQALPLLAAVALVALLAVAGVVFAAGEVPTSLRPIDLRCDWMMDPLGVDSTPPRLSWKLQGDGTRGLTQGGWQVLVASSPEGLGTHEGDVWDSGRVESAEQLHVPYGGRPLRSDERVFWKVRVWDGEGRASAWSAPGTWTMGVLEADGWQGRWITDPELLLCGIHNGVASWPWLTSLSFHDQ